MTLEEFEKIMVFPTFVFKFIFILILIFIFICYVIPTFPFLLILWITSKKSFDECFYIFRYDFCMYIIRDFIEDL